jgi:NADPH2:quinone reductase
MQAAWYEQNGAAREVLRLGKIADPEPGPGEVRVRLHFSGVNPSDVKARGGSRKIMWPQLIPHSDGAGEIDRVGEGVSKQRVGQRVWTWNGQWKRPFGTCAEYIVLPERMAVPLPAHISLEAGACLGIPAMTASHAVEVAEARPGVTLLISGGAGAVSHYAIQFAKARGATVITTVSSEAKAALAREAGADHVIDYKRDSVGDRVKALTGDHGVDGVVELDIGVNAKLIPDVLRPRGAVVIYGTSKPVIELPSMFCLTNQIKLQWVFIYELSDAERERTVGEIQRMLEANTLKHNVALTLPLSEIVAAHEAVEQGKTLGNVVIKL